MEDNPFSVGSLIDETDEEAEPLLQRVKAPEAAVRVRQAWALEESGDELPGGALSQGTRRTFRFAHMIQPVTTLSVLLLFALSFAEPAAGCEPWGCERGKEEMPHSYMWMPWMVLLPLQGILTLPLVMSSVAEAILQQGSRKNKWRLYLVVAKLVNIVLLIAHTGLGMAYRHLEWPPRLGAYLRAMAVLMEVPLAREAARIVLGVLPSFGGVVVGVAAFSFIGGWVSKVALEGSEDVEAAKPFASLTRAAKSSFSLLLGDDTPDLWAGLIEVNHLYALLFVPLIVAGNLWLMPLTLGSIYGAYKAHLSARVKKLGRRRDERLDEAFELLEEQHEGELQLASIEALLEELDQFPSLPSLGEERAKRVFHRLDDDKSMMIDSYEFRRLCSVLRHLYAKAKKDGEIDDNAGALERMWYKPWAPMRWLSAKALDVIVTALLCVNAVTLFLETEVAGSGTLAERCLIFIEAGFTCVYVIEIIIKLCKFSPHAYFYSRLNCWDFAVTLVSFVMQLLTWVPNNVGFWGAVRIALLARLVRLVRLFHRIPRARRAIQALERALPPATGLIIAFMAFLAMLCQLGVQLFGGAVYASNPNLAGSDYLKSGFQVFSFNDFPSGMLLLFNLCIVNEWSIFVEAYDKMATPWASVLLLFDLAFSALLLKNLLVAFVVEATQAEMEKVEEINPHGSHPSSRLDRTIAMLQEGETDDDDNDLVRR